VADRILADRLAVEENSPLGWLNEPRDHFHRG
jgi:hypothetical protein